MNKEIINNFKSFFLGEITEENINKIINDFYGIKTSYTASGDVGSAVFYLHFHISIKDGKSFYGNAGGVSVPGGGKFFGTLFCDDLNNLYQNTSSFEFQSTSAYISLLFFDSSTKLLGHFQGGAISTVLGIGGGSGSWQ
ncbi:VapA/VapB family virulence-associated protein (plasmid) [Edwardsiella tarda]|uniref:VapA/VapB family virulence-associated protein n=1 Tax=Edwardsiella tarda TaxID=636 RepID=UPI0024450227|nr:VapA/VapB family virulence-associated protein [Edwardsiella tarda]WGE31066.1 VapA/VapB family virulence-associated protein [Edwardsiella tarda]